MVNPAAINAAGLPLIQEFLIIVRPQPLLCILVEGEIRAPGYGFQDMELF